MAQFAAKNPPWVRASGAANLSQPPPPGTSLATSLLAAQTPAAAAAATGQITAAVPTANLATAAAVVAAAQVQQSQQAQSAPAVSTPYGANLAAITLTQSALQQGAVLQQPGIAIPASLAATTQVNSGVVVELARLPQPGVALPTSLATTQVATVSYPTPRLLAQTGQLQAHSHQTAVVQQTATQVSQTLNKQRVFTGTVTKLHDNFGFVDDDVFFQMSAIKGNIPKTGERVLVEAAYNPTMPFKWNATRIQVLPNQLAVQQATNNRQQQLNQNPSLATAVMAGPVSVALVTPGVNVNAVGSNQAQFTSINQQSRWQVQQELSLAEQMGARLSVLSRRHSPPLPSLRRDRERDNRRDDRRDRYRDRERYPSPPRKRSRSPRRSSRSPPRRRQRVTPRYSVQIPRISLDLKVGDVMELRKRYSNLYIPSDFSSANIVWQEAFPLHQPFSLDHPCNFHIVSKSIEQTVEGDTVQDPIDTDHRYSAKVMLLATPLLKEIFKKACALAEDSEEAKENFIHCTRMISFLVGLKGKNETVAIGGPWSPSLDGPNPDKDPSVLIRTAIRTCRTLTGIDLSRCSQWYRFAEIYYRRGESTHKGRVLPTRVETVVIFLPDVWSCLPTRSEWDGLVSGKQLLKKPNHEEPENQDNGDSEKREPTHYSELDMNTIEVRDLKRELESRNLSSKGLKSQLIVRLSKALKSEKIEMNEQDAVKQDNEDLKDGDNGANEKEPEKTSNGNGDNKDDVKQAVTTKCANKEQITESVGVQTTIVGEDENKDIRENNRNANLKGNNKYESKNDDMLGVNMEEKEGSEQKLKSEKFDKTAYERKLPLPDNPVIMVYPSRTAKGGKFDCTVMSLSILLDYRQEDNKEHSFEVSLFAELFNEMIMRDFGFQIYCALVEAPEGKDDEKDKKKAEKKDDQKYKKDEKDDYRRKDDVDDSDDDDSDDDDYDGDDKKDRERRRRRKRKVQMYTHSPYLLLSCVYFDQTHCGYLMDKDLEELLFTLGLQLSRAQVRKLIQKVSRKEMFRYRKLTDRPVGEGENQNDSDIQMTDLEQLAAGNRRQLALPNLDGVNDSESNAAQDVGNASNQNAVEAQHVMHKGMLVDVGNLLKQLERSERARVDVEYQLRAVEQELNDINEVASSKSKQCQKLTSNLEENQRRLQNAHGDLRKSLLQNEKYQRTLMVCKDQLQAATSTVDSILKIKPLRLSTSRVNESNSSKRDNDSDSSRDSKSSKAEGKQSRDYAHSSSPNGSDDSGRSRTKSRTMADCFSSNQKDEYAD